MGGPGGTKDESKQRWTGRRERGPFSIHTGSGQDLRVVGGRSEKMLGSELCTDPFCDVVKRKGLGDRRSEAAGRQREGQRFRLRSADYEKMHGQHIPLEIKCVTCGRRKFQTFVASPSP